MFRSVMGRAIFPGGVLGVMLVRVVSRSITRLLQLGGLTVLGNGLGWSRMIMFTRRGMMMGGLVCGAVMRAMVM